MTSISPVRPERAGAVRAVQAAVPSDAELLARCRQRDAAAWSMLVTRYERLVWSVAIRNGVSPEDAADITQTTFVTLIDSLHRLRDDQQLASWLMTVARRQAWRIRNLDRRKVSVEEVPEPAPATHDPYAEWDSLTALHDALAVLGGTCRELLHALYFDPAEPSYAEIAERFGRSIGGIGPLRGRCLQKLRDLLEEDQSS
ncbi:RNA polymerase sigma factor [Nocardioides massiliensis]|uniref:RNA polymerase sigma factor (Sigma-70 family) n=1 Tax=Nocardioides massiliensis TaxID=1325935 RepID=A0ABT9NMB0_9ACTN|nr:sigma-70 family RNA polymerase sigma factor [Nocardioides massiliensis]MDP9821558.1 RNA polymerase sigma factor (sigma-70 family) [Nocardioides massiliensis]